MIEMELISYKDLIEKIISYFTYRQTTCSIYNIIL